MSELTDKVVAFYAVMDDGCDDEREAEFEEVRPFIDTHPELSQLRTWRRQHMNMDEADAIPSL